MPYIVLRRTDIPDGILQATLDLAPNTSQPKRGPYEPYSQTGYNNEPDAEQVALTAGFATVAEYDGLAAWLIANISDGSGASATGSITTDVPGTFSDGDNFQIDDGNTTLSFEFNVTGTWGVLSPRVEVDISAAANADDVRDAIIAAVNGATPALGYNIVASNGGVATVNLVNNNENLSAALRNVAITDSGIGGAWATAGMAGATDSAALTAGQAWTDAADLEALAQAGTGLTQAAINGALTTGTVTVGQVEELLRILSGESYTVPAGTVVQVAGAFTPAGSSNYFGGDVRHVYDSGRLRISFTEGRLHLARQATFEYGGVAGAALEVYDDDGVVYTP